MYYDLLGFADRRQMPNNIEDNSMDVTDFSVYYDLDTNAVSIYD